MDVLLYAFIGPLGLIALVALFALFFGRIERVFSSFGFAIVALVLTLVLFAPQVAFAASIDIGAALGDTLRDVVSATLTLTTLIGWVGYLAQKWLGAGIEASHRDALKTFLERQASALVSRGMVKLEGLKIDVDSVALAAAANSALSAIPQALRVFGLSPADIGERIVQLIPKQPAVANALAIAMDVANPETPSQPAS